MKDQNLFEKYLPYAIALGVSDRWAKAFEGIYREAPCMRRREAAEAGFPEEGEVQEGEGGEEAEEAGDPDGGIPPPLPLILAFHNQSLLDGSGPGIVPSSHTVRPAAATMA